MDDLAALRQRMLVLQSSLEDLFDDVVDLREASPSGSDSKREARRMADRIERALRRLEKIDA